MEAKIKEHISFLFKDAPSCSRTTELENEILQNTLDKYNDLVSQGKTPDQAYNMAVEGIGDVSELIDMLKHEKNGTVSPDTQKSGKRSAALVAIAVMLYILSILPPILFSSSVYVESLGPSLMFVMIAIATGLLVFNSKLHSVYKKTDDTVVEDFKEWKNEKVRNESSVIKAICSLIWAIGLAGYFLLSFSTGAWYITWVIFPLIGAVNGIIMAIGNLFK